LAEAITAGCLGWATYFGAVWIRYAHVRRTRAPGADLDSFIPDPEIEEAHETRVEAPAAICPAPRRKLDIQRSAWFGRLRPRTPSPGCAVTRPDGRGQGRRKRPRIGWGVLADVPGQRFVAGAVTRPWEADVKLRALPPEEFATFDDPGYAKIVWTLEWPAPR
jgi:hypothetical protein